MFESAPWCTASIGYADTDTCENPWRGVASGVPAAESPPAPYRYSGNVGGVPGGASTSGVATTGNAAAGSARVESLAAWLALAT